jgi:hypothetical protein
MARISSAVAAWIRQCGSDRSEKTSGANSASGTDPVSRNRISFATATLVSCRTCLPILPVAVLVMALLLISVLMPALPIR